MKPNGADAPSRALGKRKTTKCVKQQNANSSKTEQN
jgi:hypothetical protein